MDEPYPQKELDPNSNSGRAGDGSGALACVYAVGGDIIFRELIAKMYTGMPKCNMGMGDEETPM